MPPFRNAEPKQTLSSSSGEEEEEAAVEDASSSEGEEAEHEKPTKKKPSAQNQPNTSKTRISHPQPSPSSNSEPDSPSRPDPKSKPAAPKRKASGVVEEMGKNKQLFGEEDEISILKGMIGFKSEKGLEPGPHVNAFLEFVKESLRFSGASKTQLYEKMRRLRQRYESNLLRGKEDGKERPVFSRASRTHEEKVFDLSKQIWGNVEGGSGRAKVNASVRKSGSRTGRVGLRKGGEKREVEIIEVDAEVEASAGGFWSGGFCGSVSGLSSGEKIVKDGLGLISDSSKVELERKLKKLRAEETKLYCKKLGLICKQTVAVLEVMKSQGD
ncbi:hypothetical protein RHGRI_031031 [Rhododendron griersonianum]|uniref:Glabrous enhancer-binding protein-like DBD domain-containing protein n=1 Tax=Rhododendron griersonianum TaxID=479676 RepID=A0AAV6I8W9_9ERIC|nr:hypothetical protein RHGRI_031031 [Rhododendron griersonianum]